MPTRETPFGAYNFLVEFDGNEASNSALGGFSDVSGLGAEITLMEYRQGNDRENRVRKIPALHKASDVTLKRGIMGLTNFWQWVSVTRADTTHKRNVSIELQDIEREVAALAVGSKSILDGAETILAATAEMTKAARQIAAAAEEASAATREAATAATQQSRGVEDLAAAIEEIATLADELKKAT